MPEVKPMLVKCEDGRIGMQMRLGPFTATMPLPDHLAGQTAEELEPFFDLVVPEMMKNLLVMQQQEAKRMKKRAKKANL